MPTATQAFTDEQAARDAMRALIRRGYDKARVALHRPMQGESFTVSVDVDAADKAAADLLRRAAQASASFAAVRGAIKVNPIGMLAVAFAGGYVARVLMRR